MCKAHSKVTHIKQQKYFHHLKGCGYNKNYVLYPTALQVMKLFLLFYMCHFAMGLTHCYKTTVFFTFTFVVFIAHRCDIDIAILSVCLSVTFRYQMKTA